MLRGMSRRIGRWLCARGLHKWTHKSAVDRDESDGLVLVVTDYAWCVRPDCDEQTHIVNYETKRIA